MGTHGTEYDSAVNKTEARGSVDEADSHPARGRGSPPRARPSAEYLEWGNAGREKQVSVCRAGCGGTRGVAADGPLNSFQRP